MRWGETNLFMTKKLAKKSNTFFSRPPVVAVVGHIDHGKTTLLDKIRESQIAPREAGGITQHIGASQITIKTKDNKERKITFIDTPGHAIFTKMRARGVNTTDLVILVVAADSGVQEQTKESLDHIKAAKVSFLVAINKIDLPTANLEKIKAQLAENEVIPEDYGGDIVVVPVSAKTGQGIDNLLEMVLLMADLQELKADPTGELGGVIIESTLDSRRGPLATVLIKGGTLKTGDSIFAESIKAKVKAMRNWLGKSVREAVPSDPVEILGFKQVPLVGASVAKEPKEFKREKIKTIDQKECTLKLVVKTDVGGSLEALLASLPNGVEVIHSGVGEITDGDVFLAQTGRADIFGFNVKIASAAKRVASQSGVKVFQAKIIYEVLEEIEKRIEKKLDPLSEKEILGKAEIVAEFKIDGKRIAGCRTTEGKIFRDGKALLMRGEEVIGETVVVSMKHLKEDIKKSEENQEFGAVFSPPLDFIKGDVIISYNHAESNAREQSLSKNQ